MTPAWGRPAFAVVLVLRMGSPAPLASPLLIKASPSPFRSQFSLSLPCGDADILWVPMSSDQVPSEEGQRLRSALASVLQQPPSGKVTLTAGGGKPAKPELPTNRSFVFADSIPGHRLRLWVEM